MVKYYLGGKNILLGRRPGEKIDWLENLQVGNYPGGRMAWLENDIVKVGRIHLIMSQVKKR